MASTSSTSSATGATLNVGGLATGIDTNAIVDKLVQLESIPLTRLQSQQSAFKTQISLLADLASRLEDLKSASASLASSGVMAPQVTSSTSSFSAVAGAGAAAGSYSVEVSALATAAKWRSQPVGANPLQPGTLRVTVNGTVYPPLTSDAIAITADSTLESVAASIRASGAPVSATVLDNGTDKYLSITNSATGFTGLQQQALRVVFDPTDRLAPASALSSASHTEDAWNASFTVDGLPFTRTSNAVTDVIPGTTLTLDAQDGPAETLSIGYDATATQKNLQKFVDSYNALIGAIQKQLDVSSTTNRSTTLAGDSNVRSLQQALQSITSAIGHAQGTVHSLADLGVKTNRDGTLGIDSAVLSAAVARDPLGVNAVFAQATTGIAQRVSTVASSYSSVTGLLSTEQVSLQKRVSTIDLQAAQLQARINAYHDQLIAQFAAMENIVASFKSIGDFLTQQDNAKK